MSEAYSKNVNTLDFETGSRPTQDEHEVVGDGDTVDSLCEWTIRALESGKFGWRNRSF